MINEKNTVDIISNQRNLEKSMPNAVVNVAPADVLALLWGYDIPGRHTFESLMCSTFDQ